MIQDSAIVSTGMGDRGTSIGIEPTESAQASCELQVSYIVYLKLFNDSLGRQFSRHQALLAAIMYIKIIK